MIRNAKKLKFLPNCKRSINKKNRINLKKKHLLNFLQEWWCSPMKLPAIWRKKHWIIKIKLNINRTYKSFLWLKWIMLKIILRYNRNKWYKWSKWKFHNGWLNFNKKSYKISNNNNDINRNICKSHNRKCQN